MQGAFSGCLKPGKQNKYNMWREVHMKLTKRLLGLLMVLMLLMTTASCGGGNEPKKDSCTNMANAGMNPKALQYLMGHANIIMILNYYAHATFDTTQIGRASCRERV